MWSYDPTIPRSLDAVRLAVGDTTEADPQLQDEEIGYLLIQQPNVLAAAITAAKRIAGKYARLLTERTADQSQNAGDLYRHYTDLAASLRDDLLRGAGGPVGIPGTGQAGLVYAGGLSANEHRQDNLNPDLMQPIMTKEAFSQPGTEPNAGNNDPAYTDRLFNP